LCETGNRRRFQSKQRTGSKEPNLKRKPNNMPITSEAVSKEKKGDRPNHMPATPEDIPGAQMMLCCLPSPKLHVSKEKRTPMMLMMMMVGMLNVLSLSRKHACPLLAQLQSSHRQ
jgi:hypothetical protein